MCMVASTFGNDIVDMLLLWCRVLVWQISYWCSIVKPLLPGLWLFVAFKRLTEARG